MIDNVDIHLIFKNINSLLLTMFLVIPHEIYNYFRKDVCNSIIFFQKLNGNLMRKTAQYIDYLDFTIAIFEH